MSAVDADALKRASGLPSPIGVAERALVLSQGDESALPEFTESIGADPGLSASVLRFANAKLLGAPAPTPTVRDAMTRIGHRAVRVASISAILVAAEMDMEAAGEALAPLWKHALARSITARRLALHLDPRRAGDAFQSAALADIAMLALWRVDPNMCDRVLASGEPGSKARADAERGAFGMSCAEQSAALLRHWRLPRRIWGSVRGLAPGEEHAEAAGEGGTILRAAEASASLIMCDPASAEPAALERARRVLAIDASLFHSLLRAAREEYIQHEPLLAPCSDAPLRLERLRREAQRVLAELSLATQIENRVMLRRQQELMRRVTTDSLTGVKNRLAFDERLLDEFERCQRSGKPLTLFLVDLDHFKKFNDSFGHQAGDLMLRTAASALASVARRVDMVARYGGEEFVVVAPDCGYAGAVALGERLRLAVADAAVDWKGQSLRTTASIGGAVAPGGTHGRTPTEMVAAADRLLYKAKAGGRNRTLVEAEPIDAGLRAQSLARDEHTQVRATKG